MSGLSARICGVTIAPTTTMFAVAPVALEAVGERERPGLRRGLRGGVGGVRMRRRLRLARRDEHEAAAARSHEVRRERLGRVLDGSHEERAQEVPVLERRLLDRRAPAPAADEVDEPVHAALVPRRERRRPCPASPSRRGGRRRRSRSARRPRRRARRGLPGRARRRMGASLRLQGGGRPSGRGCRRRRRRRSPSRPARLARGEASNARLLQSAGASQPR